MRVATLAGAIQQLAAATAALGNNNAHVPLCDPLALEAMIALGAEVKAIDSDGRPHYRIDLFGVDVWTIGPAIVMPIDQAGAA